MTASKKAAIGACAAIILLMMLWPADSQWGGDDVVLIAKAHQANREHRLIKEGLGGTYGFTYGPIPDQIYQGLLAITHDPLTLVRLHVLLFAGVTAASLLWITSTLEWPPWLAVLGLLSPYFYFYTLLLWNTTDAIPVSSLFVAAYISYVRRPSQAKYLTALACGIVLPLIHPITVPLVAAVLIHADIRLRSAKKGEPTALRRWWPGMVAVLLCAAISSGPYVVQALRPSQRETVGPVVWYLHLQLTRPQAAGFALVVGRMFSAKPFYDVRGHEGGADASALAAQARCITAIAYPLQGIGLILCAIRFRRGWRDPAGAIAAIASMTLVFQMVMDAYLRVAIFPHYYSGSWIAGWICICIAILALGRVGTVLAVLFAATLAISTTAFAVSIHQAGGGSVWFGLSFGNQLAIAERMNEYSDKYAETAIPRYAGARRISAFCVISSHRRPSGALVAGIFCFDMPRENRTRCGWNW